MKTQKVLDINEGGRRLVCIKHDEGRNPYRLYEMWWDMGWHRRQIDGYGDFNSILFRVLKEFGYTRLNVEL